MSLIPRARPILAGAALTGVLILMGGAGPAFAHGLYVVPQQSDGRVTGVVRYTDDTAAAEVPVEVLSAPDRALLGRGLTDAQGRFAISVTPTDAVIVVAEGEEGHRAEAPAPLLPATPPPAGADAAGAEPGDGNPGAPAATLAPTAEAAALQALREDFARLEHRLRLQDLLGAIGYLVGLIGAWAWWTSRRRR